MEKSYRITLRYNLEGFKMHEYSMSYKEISHQLEMEKILQICYEKIGAKSYDEICAPGSYKKAVQYGYGQGYLDGNIEITASGRALIKATANHTNAAA